MNPEHPIDKIFREKLLEKQLPPSAGAWEKVQTRSAEVHRRYYVVLRLAAMLLLVLMPQFVFWSDLPSPPRSNEQQAYRAASQAWLAGQNPNPSKVVFEAGKKTEKLPKNFAPTAREEQKKSGESAKNTPPTKPNLAQIKTHRAKISPEKNMQAVLAASAHISDNLQRIAPIDMLKTIQPIPSIAHLAIPESKPADAEKNNSVWVVINISKQLVSKNAQKNRRSDRPSPVFARVWRKVKRLPIGEQF